MAGRRYLVLDVFTRERLKGNPLAVVLDADGLSTEDMQRIANEFNLSETTFVLPPQDARHSAEVRIFTPHYEMLFAGHPTVGTAVALGAARGTDAILVLEEKVGAIRCVVSERDGVPFAEFDLPRLPEPVPFGGSAAQVAAAMGLEPSEIGFGAHGVGAHGVGAWSAGVPYVCVPVRDLDALGRARLDVDAWVGLLGSSGGDSPAAYVYCAADGAELAFRTRMFAGHHGLIEDPATGSAAAAFAGAVMQWERPGEGTRRIAITQGVEMGRPSQIQLELMVGADGLHAARIGGHAVRVAEGMLLA